MGAGTRRSALALLQRLQKVFILCRLPAVRRVKWCRAGLQRSARWNIQVFHTSVNKPVLPHGATAVWPKPGVRKKKKKRWSGKHPPSAYRFTTDLPPFATIRHHSPSFTTIRPHSPPFASIRLHSRSVPE